MYSGLRRGWVRHKHKCAAMLLLTLRGTPTIYNGDEIGMIDGDITEADIQDPQGIDLACTCHAIIAGPQPNGMIAHWQGSLRQGQIQHGYLSHRTITERNIKAQMSEMKGRYGHSISVC